MTGCAQYHSDQCRLSSVAYASEASPSVVWRVEREPHRARVTRATRCHTRTGLYIFYCELVTVRAVRVPSAISRAAVWLSGSRRALASPSDRLPQPGGGVLWCVVRSACLLE